MKLSRVAPVLSFLLAACGQGPVPSHVAASGHEVVELPIETVFDQGRSEWCWAFSTYHTLRTYYAQAQSAGSDAWRKALSPLDSQTAFTRFMSSRFDQGHGDNPGSFVDLMETEKGTPKDPWTDYYPSEHESEGPEGPEAQPKAHLATSEILAKVESNLRRQVPSVFCNPAHCRMIYGVTLDSGAVTSWSFADSLGGRTYQVDAATAEDSLDLVMTLP